MRKIIFILLASVAGYTSCKENGVDPFETKDGVYFVLDQKEWTKLTDTLECTFYRKDPTRFTVEIPVYLMGYASDRDRTYRVELDTRVASSATAAAAGTDFEEMPGYFTLPAGQYKTLIPITFIYHDYLETAIRDLALRILPSEDLGQAINGRDYLHLRITALPVRPSYWAPGEAGPQRHFGNYSRVKHRVCEEVLGIAFPEEYSEYSKYYQRWEIRGEYMSEWFRDNPTKDENDEYIII